jgi:hypothetical protein
MEAIMNDHAIVPSPLPPWWRFVARRQALDAVGRELLAKMMQATSQHGSDATAARNAAEEVFREIGNQYGLSRQELFALYDEAQSRAKEELQSAITELKRRL